MPAMTHGSDQTKNRITFAVRQHVVRCPCSLEGISHDFRIRAHLFDPSVTFHLEVFRVSYFVWKQRCACIFVVPDSSPSSSIWSRRIRHVSLFRHAGQTHRRIRNRFEYMEINWKIELRARSPPSTFVHSFLTHALATHHQLPPTTIFSPPTHTQIQTDW